MVVIWERGRHEVQSHRHRSPSSRSSPRGAARGPRLRASWPRASLRPGRTPGRKPPAMDPGRRARTPGRRPPTTTSPSPTNGRASGTEAEREYGEALRLAPDEPTVRTNHAAFKARLERLRGRTTVRGFVPLALAAALLAGAACGSGGPVGVSLSMPGIAVLPPGSFSEIIVTDFAETAPPPDFAPGLELPNYLAAEIGARFRGPGVARDGARRSRGRSGPAPVLERKGRRARRRRLPHRFRQPHRPGPQSRRPRRARRTPFQRLAAAAWSSSAVGP